MEIAFIGFIIILLCVASVGVLIENGRLKRKIKAQNGYINRCEFEIEKLNHKIRFYQNERAVTEGEEK